MEIGPVLLIAAVAVAAFFLVMRAARKRGSRFWRVYYRGQVGSLGSGSGTSEFSVRNHVDVGDARLRNVMVSARMDDALVEAQGNGDNSTVAFGWFVNRRWTLMVKTGEHVERESLLRFLFFSVVGVPVAFGVVTLIGVFAVGLIFDGRQAAILTVLGFILLCLLQMAANFWAWLGMRA